MKIKGNALFDKSCELLCYTIAVVFACIVGLSIIDFELFVKVFPFLCYILAIVMIFVGLVGFVTQQKPLCIKVCAWGIAGGLICIAGGLITSGLVLNYTILAIVLILSLIIAFISLFL